MFIMPEHIRRDMLSEANTFVAIDVEPGGATTPLGHIGVAEVADSKLADSFSLTFENPAYRSQRLDAFLSAPTEYLNLASSHAEPRVQHLGFDEVFPFLDAFVDNRLVVAYNSSYDKSAMRKLLATTDIPPVRWRFVDGYTIARRLWPSRPMPLQWLAVSLELLDETEITIRKMEKRMNPYGQGKIILKNAQEDAWACAQVILKAQEETGSKTLGDLETYIKMR